MTLANKLTLLRIIIVPIIIIVAYLPFINEYRLFFAISIGQLIIIVLFLFGSFTDFLDGYIARKTNTITTFGKFLDPIADKLLTIVAFLYLVKLDYVEVWILLIILLREFMVSGLRLVLANKETVVSASFFGKLKTTFTFVTLTFLLCNEFGLGKYTNAGCLSFIGNVGIIGIVFLLITVLLTIYSGIDYYLKNKHLLNDSNKVI